MAATRKARGKRHARGKAVERRSSSRIQELVVRPAVASASAALSAAAGVETPREVELTDAEIEATLRYADALDADVKRALIVLRKEAARHASSKPREFTIPFTPEEIKTIGHRKTVRHPPPFKRISKSIYLSTTLPVADLPVHKCNCYDDKAATSSTSRRAKVANTAPEPVVKKRGKKAVAKAPSKPTELYCGEGCHNRMLFISCSKETCSAPDPSLCTNRAIKRREAKPVRVEYVEGPGFGLFAEETIEPGEFVIEYVGEVIDDEECERRLIKYRDEGEEHFYMLEIEKDVVIDARYRSNDARFINHSCDPNSMTQKWNVDGLRRIGIFARRRIMPGEEITIDYNFSHFGDPMDCKCGSVACTGKLGLKRSDVQIKNALPIYKKSQEVVDAAPPEIKRPVLLSSLALLKSAKLDANWLNLYGFKKRRLFVGHRNGELGKKATPKSTSEAPSSSLVSSRNSSPLSSEWSATTNEDMDVPKNDWYNRFQRGDHLDEMRAMQSYICGGKYDWTDDLMDIPPRSRRTPPPSRKNKRLVTKRVGLLDARTNRFSDLIAFANGASAWNKRVPSSSSIDPGRIYRFIDAMKSGKLFLNQNLNDLNEDACHRCGLAGELICCDGCPAAFHLNCTNLVMLPPHGEPWFCSDCKRSARQRAKVEALTSTTSVPSTSTDGAAAGKRHNLRTLTNNTSTTAPVVPSLKRIFHAISTKDRTRRRPRKKLKSADKSYRLLEQMPLPVWDDEDE